MPHLAGILEEGVLGELAKCEPPVVTVEALIEKAAIVPGQCGLSQESVQEAVAAACKASWAPPVTADTLLDVKLSSCDVVPTACQPLDDLLRGGLFTSDVTEVSGHSGSGKTQLCMTAAAAVVVRTPGLVYYVDTVGSCSAKRLAEIVDAHVGSHADHLGHVFDSVAKADSVAECISRVQIRKAFRASDVLAVLAEVEAALAHVTSHDVEDSPAEGLAALFMKCQPVLVVVDSVSAVLTPELGGTKNAAGHALMMDMAASLRRIASVYAMAVLVTNGSVVDRSAMGATMPALGPSWLSVPDTRVWLVDGEAYLTQSQRLPVARMTPFTIGAHGCMPHSSEPVGMLVPAAASPWVVSFWTEPAAAEDDEL